MWQQRAKTMRQFLGSTWLARCAMSVAIQAPRHVWRLPHVLPGVGLHQRLQFREQVAEPARWQDAARIPLSLMMNSARGDGTNHRNVEKFSSPLDQEKGRRALRRRPCLATAGSRVRFRCIAFHLPTSTLIRSTQRRLKPLHAGMANPYRGRLNYEIGWSLLSVGLGRPIKSSIVAGC